jgi:hypothetical protein
MTTAKHFLLEVGNIQGMKTIKCKKNGSTAPAMLPKKRERKGTWCLQKMKKSSTV